MILLTLSTLIAIGLPILFWYNRHKSWGSLITRNIFTIPLILLGIWIYLFPETTGIKSVRFDVKSISLGFIHPQISLILEAMLSGLSYLICGRDFYVWMRHSKDVKNRNIQITWLDKLISMILIYGSIFLFIGLMRWMKIKT